MNYLDNLLSTKKTKYQLPDGSFTNDFLVWHNSHSTHEVDISALAQQKFASDATKQYELRDGSFTSDFWRWQDDQSTVKVDAISNVAKNKLIPEKKDEASSSNPLKHFLEEQTFRRYKLADGSYTTDFIVYHNDQNNNKEGIRRRLIKPKMNAFEHFVENLAMENRLQSRSFFTGKKTDISYLAEKTYYLFGITFKFIPYGENECYEDSTVEEFHRMAHEFTRQMLILNKYDPEKPDDIIKFLDEYMKKYPKMHPESLKEHVYFPRKR